jgi:hypothetical protein
MGSGVPSAGVALSSTDVFFAGVSSQQKFSALLKMLRAGLT